MRTGLFFKLCFDKSKRRLVTNPKVKGTSWKQCYWTYRKLLTCCETSYQWIFTFNSAIIFFIRDFFRLTLINQRAEEAERVYSNSTLPRPRATQALRSSPVVTVESSFLHIAGDWNWTLEPWFLSRRR